MLCMLTKFSQVAQSQMACVTVDDEEVQNILNNTGLSASFITLGRDLGVFEAKTAEEDIYKSHLEVVPGSCSKKKSLFRKACCVISYSTALFVD